MVPIAACGDRHPCRSGYLHAAPCPGCLGDGTRAVLDDAVPVELTPGQYLAANGKKRAHLAGGHPVSGAASRRPLEMVPLHVAADLADELAAERAHADRLADALHVASILPTEAERRSLVSKVLNAHDERRKADR